LAPDGEKKEKAFTCEKQGRVLGIDFRSKDLTWSLPSEKVEKTLRRLKFCLENKVSLEDCQKLLGSLNDLGQMVPVLSIFKRAFLNDLRILSNLPEGTRMNIGNDAKKELMAWAGFLMDSDKWHGVPHEPCSPTIKAREVFSDAAGVPAENKNLRKGEGVAVISFNRKGEIDFAQRWEWPRVFIEELSDATGTRFGDKTMTLEFLGVLLPVLVSPSCFKNQHVIFFLDNIACVYGWENNGCKEDGTASILIRALKLIQFFLGSCFHLRFIPRKSSWESDMTDRMTRTSSLSRNDMKLLNSFKKEEFPAPIRRWLQTPSEDWDVALEILNFVCMKFE